MPKEKNELNCRLRLIEIIKRNTDKEHPLTQEKLREISGDNEAFGYKNTFSRRLFEIANALNTYENGELLPENNWKIVYPGYRKKRENPSAKGIRNGKIYYNHELTKAEIDFLIHQVRATKLLGEKEKQMLENKISTILASKYYSYKDENRDFTDNEIVYDFGGAYSKDLSDKLTFLKQAIRMKQMVSFNVLSVYYDGRYAVHSIKPNLVSPYRIVHYNGLYYLLGNCQREYVSENWVNFSSKVSMYRIDLMTDLKRAKERYYKPARFPYGTRTAVDMWDKQVCFQQNKEITDCPEISFKVLWNNFANAERYDCTFIYDTFGKIAKVKDGVFTVKSSVDFFTDWAMKYADKIKITDQSQGSLLVKSKIKARLEKALKNFS